MKILNKRQVLLLHQHLVEETGGSPGLRDEGLLESALNAPFQSFGDTSAYPSLQQKAARLCYGLVRNHPFVDGNKRIGAHAMLVFLALNGVELSYTQRELADIILQLAPVKKTMKNSWLGCLPIRCDTNIPIRVNLGTGICQKPGIDPNGIFFMCTDRVYPNDTLQSVCAANGLPDFLTRILRQSAQDLPAES